jgi:hypothetical protein
MAHSKNSLVTVERGLQELLDAAQRPGAHAKDVAALEQLFEDSSILWKAASLAHNAAFGAIEIESGDRDGIRVAMRANYLGVRRELGSNDASPMERLLIDHVALCWLRLQTLEQRYSRVMSESIILTLGQYWEKRLSAAQRRYLRACTTLARIRKMRLPAMQVNIAAEGGWHVNIAS